MAVVTAERIIKNRRKTHTRTCMYVRLAINVHNAFRMIIYANARSNFAPVNQTERNVREILTNKTRSGEAVFRSVLNNNDDLRVRNVTHARTMDVCGVKDSGFDPPPPKCLYTSQVFPYKQILKIVEI